MPDVHQTKISSALLSLSLARCPTPHPPSPAEAHGVAPPSSPRGGTRRRTLGWRGFYRVGRGVRPRRDGRRGHPHPRVPSQEAGLHLLRRRQRRIQHQVRRPTRLILFLLGFSPVQWSNSPAFTPVCCFSSFLPFSSPIRSIRPFSASTGPSDHRRRRPTPSCPGPFADDERPPQQVLFPPSLPFLLCKTEHPVPNPIWI